MTTRITRMRFVIGVILLGLAGGAWLAPNRQTRGICLLLLFFGVIAVVVTWLANASGRLSPSGRDPQDVGDAS